MTATPYLVTEEKSAGGTTWIALRARGAEWSYLTPEEALRLADEWKAKYGKKEPATPLK